MLQHKIKIETTGHYFLLGEPSPAVRQFWIVCHGYAQTADEFLKKFELLDDGKKLVVAPEGLNHFYKKGFDGDVAATWMTRRHREDKIGDYSNFLQTILEKYLPELSADVRVVLLGFSQGTATVCRWMMEKRPNFHDLICWSGMPPEDLDYKSAADYLKTKNLYLLYGSTDPFLTPDRLTAVQEIERKNSVDFDEKPFVGGHEIPIEVLRDFLKNIQN